MKTNKELAADILEKLGGADNVTHATHCITRLRVNLADDSKGDLDALKQMDGAMGAQIKDGQWQVIIGPKVGDVFLEFEPLLGAKSAGDMDLDAGGKAKVLDILTDHSGACRGRHRQGRPGGHRRLRYRYRIGGLGHLQHDVRYPVLLPAVFAVRLGC